MEPAQQPPGQEFERSAKAPPHPFDKRWYAHVDGKTYGPYTGHQIRRMFEQHKIVDSDFVYAESEGESAWRQLASDPILGTLVKNSKAANSLSEPRRWPRKWLLIALIVSVIGWTVWPYYAVYSLVVAVHDGDVSVLENRVAWEKVRQALRGDLNAALLEKLDSEKRKQSDSNAALGTGFAALLGPAIVDRIVDSYVTPQAVAAANRVGKANVVPSATSNGSQALTEKLQAAQHIRWSQIKYAFFSGGPMTFRVELLPDYNPPSQERTEFQFQWDGDWRLTRIKLPVDAIGKPSISAKNEDAAASAASKVAENDVSSKTTSTSKQKLPEPLNITLVSKGFKASNYRSGDYEDQITLKLSIKNMLDKGIRAFDGVIFFTDLLDNEILSLKLAVNDPLDAGAILGWDGSMRYNQFIDRHQNLRNERQENLKIKFITHKILFADGSSKEY